MKKRIVFSTALFTVCAILFSLFMLHPVRETVLDIKSPGGHLFASIVLPNNQFDLVFIHSIHLTPVVERFTIEKADNGDAMMHLYELQYQSSGVGMPADAENGYRLENGVFILAMNRQFRKIPVMVSIVEGHGVVVEGQTYPFLSWTEIETPLILTGRIVKRIQFKR